MHTWMLGIADSACLKQIVSFNPLTLTDNVGPSRTWLRTISGGSRTLPCSQLSFNHVDMIGKI